MSLTLKFVKITKIIFNKISCDIHPIQMLSAMFLVCVWGGGGGGCTVGPSGSLTIPLSRLRENKEKIPTEQELEDQRSGEDARV